MTTFILRSRLEHAVHYFVHPDAERVLDKASTIVAHEQAIATVPVDRLADANSVINQFNAALASGRVVNL